MAHFGCSEILLGATERALQFEAASSSGCRYIKTNHFMTVEAADIDDSIRRKHIRVLEVCGYTRTRGYGSGRVKRARVRVDPVLPVYF